MTPEQRAQTLMMPDVKIVADAIRAEMWKFGIQLGKTELAAVAGAAIEAIRALEPKP